MENKFPETSTTRSKTQRVIPLTLQILSAMSRFNKPTSSITSLNDTNSQESTVDQFNYVLDGLKQNCAMTARMGLINKPDTCSARSEGITSREYFLQGNGAMNSKTNCKNEFSGATSMDVLYDTTTSNSIVKFPIVRTHEIDQSSSSSICIDYDEDEQRKCDFIESSLKLLNDRISILEEQMTTLLNAFPEFNEIHNEYFQTDFTFLVEKFAEFVGKTYENYFSDEASLSEN